MNEILAGITHWTTYHPAISTRVSSYHVAPAGIVVDPLLPEEGLPFRPDAVVLTSGLHTRDAGSFGVPVRAPREGLEPHRRREAFSGLLSLEFDSLLFAHGEPLVGGGKKALRRLIEAAS